MIFYVDFFLHFHEWPKNYRIWTLQSKWQLRPPDITRGGLMNFRCFFGRGTYFAKISKIYLGSPHNYHDKFYQRNFVSGGHYLNILFFKCKKCDEMHIHFLQCSRVYSQWVLKLGVISFFSFSNSFDKTIDESQLWLDSH